jgi:hypothetical protein
LDSVRKKEVKKKEKKKKKGKKKREGKWKQEPLAVLIQTRGRTF